MNSLKLKFTTLAFVALAAAGFTACDAMKSAPKAAVTKEQASQTALAVVPGGTVEDGDYKKEGNQWVYSFEIKAASGERIVWVDPQSGKVIKNEEEKK